MLAKVTTAASITRAVFVVHDHAVTIGQDFLAGTPKAPFILDGVIFLNGAIDPAQHRARLIQRFIASRVGAVLGVPLLNRRTVLRALRARCSCAKSGSRRTTYGESITSHDGLAIQPRLCTTSPSDAGRR
ncbi:MAG: hypothetical protein IPG76_04045 [Acidobacteria bacterium]|nr:hypothetical protein [Acidobacteriota bacterium]